MTPEGERKLIRIRKKPLMTFIGDVGEAIRAGHADDEAAARQAQIAEDNANLLKIAASIGAKTGIPKDAYAALTDEPAQRAPITAFPKFDPHDVPKVKHPERFDAPRLLRGAGATFRDKGKTILQDKFTDDDLRNPDHPVCAINEEKFHTLPESVKRQLHLLAGIARKYQAGRTFTLPYDPQGLKEWRGAVYTQYGSAVPEVVETERRNRVKFSNIFQLGLPANMLLRNTETPASLAGEVEDLTAGLDTIIRPSERGAAEFQERYGFKMTEREKAEFVERVGDTAAEEMLKFVA